MKYIDKQISEELFPNFSSFDRAIKYPYFAPDYSFSFYKGKFVKGIIDNSKLGSAFFCVISIGLLSLKGYAM